MKKLLYIFIVIFMSCESFGELKEQSGISYYDAVAFGWQAFFDNDYELALNWFNTAYEAIDQDLHNSAHVGLAWTYHFIANYGTEEQLVLCGGGVDECRNAAFEEFLYDTDEAEAVESYDENCIYFEFCCDDCFVNDRGLGLSFHYIKEAIDTDNDILLSEQIIVLQEFLDSNTIPQVDSDYMFMAGKPTGTLGETVIWDSNTIAVYLAGLYLRTNQINEATDNSKACELLLEHELSCDITSCEDADYYYHDLVQCIEQQSLENQVPFSE